MSLQICKSNKPIPEVVGAYGIAEARSEQILENGDAVFDSCLVSQARSCLYKDTCLKASEQLAFRGRPIREKTSFGERLGGIFIKQGSEPCALQIEFLELYGDFDHRSLMFSLLLSSCAETFPPVQWRHRARCEYGATRL